jgi:predicted secreted Zn-dependent protease
MSAAAILIPKAYAAEESPDRASVTPPETVKHYDVRGTTLDTLRAEVFSRGPLDRSSRQRFAGWTDWEINWRYEFAEVPESCRLQQVSAEAHVVYTLPRWVDEAKATPSLRVAWTRFSDALTEHERGHGEIARKLAKRVEAEMRAIPPQPTCAELERRINALGAEIVDNDEEQVAYDRRTGHGETQGASFPRTLARARSAPQASNQ